jgi:hypothetical protein
MQLVRPSAAKAATELSNIGGGRALSAFSPQQSASSMCVCLISPFHEAKLLCKTQRSHRYRIYPLKSYLSSSISAP